MRSYSETTLSECRQQFSNLSRGSGQPWKAHYIDLFHGPSALKCKSGAVGSERASRVPTVSQIADNRTCFQFLQSSSKPGQVLMATQQCYKNLR
ncbi:hypothetical protein PoB_003051900 [Plakobranchus ocellatus]|uniref:Uncharacterized protein n=1 Tax=Plakobranchus ocellatus TaxID=259542 RepID=A0AAV4AC68_9GAST|nr:hypothetical protein PoB_003051900 [Plakobranchus ocellatus]